jgi:hypothetical protein
MCSYRKNPRHGHYQATDPHAAVEAGTTTTLPQDGQGFDWPAIESGELISS